jgi:uncharacterized protein (DUF433 family)
MAAPAGGIGPGGTAFQKQQTQVLAMERHQIISRHPEVMNGALVFAGTRVPVEILVQHLAAGDCLDKFLDDFPTVSREQAVGYLEMMLHEAEAA